MVFGGRDRDVEESAVDEGEVSEGVGDVNGPGIERCFGVGAGVFVEFALVLGESADGLSAVGGV